ncbi:MAG: hypothetical protein BWX70_01655 [Verrucomicrobia bacterium ADurb.Bin070]|nr:MAG: hypothetical protein BWX70_01655 [Verrucomicrobia bacterium ADurb.Bin070]
MIRERPAGLGLAHAEQALGVLQIFRHPEPVDVVDENNRRERDRQQQRTGYPHQRAHGFQNPRLVTRTRRLRLVVRRVLQAEDRDKAEQHTEEPERGKRPAPPPMIGDQRRQHPARHHTDVERRLVDRHRHRARLFVERGEQRVPRGRIHRLTRGGGHAVEEHEREKPHGGTGQRGRRAADDQRPGDDPLAAVAVTQNP